MGRVEPNTYVHRQYWGWHNAPPFRSYAAAHRDGDNAWFLGVKFDGEVLASFDDPSAGWIDWHDPGSVTRPSLMKVAATGHRDGLQFWGIDDSLRLWSVSKDRFFGNWEGPNWNNAQPVFRITAVRLGGPRTVAIWAIKATDYSLTWCYTENNAWSSWTPFKPTPTNSRFMDIAAAQQANGCAALWALDTGHNLWFCQENAPGGSWSEWSGPHWNAEPPDWARTGVPLLDRLAACQQAGSRGALLWALSGMNLANTRQVPGGTWSPWSTALGQNASGHVMRMAAAQQSNGAVRLWTTSPHDLSLWSIAQTSADGDWGKWEGQFIQ